MADAAAVNPVEKQALTAQAGRNNAPGLFERMRRIMCNCTYQKSAVRTYNSTPQTIATADPTQLTLLGSTCTDTGCSIKAQPAAMQILNRGLYYMAADVTYTGGGAGTTVIQLYNGETPLPCAIAQESTGAGFVYTIHLETVLPLVRCAALTPSINLRISGVAGNVVDWVGMSIIREA